MTAETVPTKELDAALRAVDPRARIVPPRILRRIIKQEQKLGVLGIHVSHHRSLTIATSAALRAVRPGDLGLDFGAAMPDELILIGEPDEDFAENDRGDALLWAWRCLFHESVHVALRDRIDAGRLGAAEIAGRIDRIGRREYAEIRSVLDRDAWLLAPEDEVAVYEEFAAVYLEIRHFAETLLPAFFPGIEDFLRIDAILSEDVDGPALFAATRLSGAVDPHPHREVVDLTKTGAAPRPAEVRGRGSEAKYRWLLARADRARKAGNLVRSAIARTRAAGLVGPSLAGQARSGAEDDLNRLANRLVAAVGTDGGGLPRWRPALSALLAGSDRAVWTVEARLLYDLQSVCLDHEREVFQLDLIGWLVSLGRRPLKRPLPNQKLVRTSKHLRRATARLPRLILVEEARSALAWYLHAATQSAEGQLRDRFRPLIARSLSRAELEPRNLPERVSSDRMTEELLDLVVSRNYLTMGDLRDAMARGDLRQPDLSGPRELARGDRVLKANRRFAVSLDGVYHRGEIYLRMLQRMSLLGFGTRTGRWLTRYVALPYGGAFGALVTVQEILGLIRVHIEMVHLSTVAILGTFLLLLLHFPRFRNLFLGATAVALRVLKTVLVDVPAWLLQRPAIRAILDSRWFDLARRLVLEPLLGAGVVYGLVYALDHDPRVALAIGVTVYLAMAAFLGTRWGRETEELAADALARGWRRLRTDLLPGLIRYILEVFDLFLETVERILYTVDEHLRFRSGQGRMALWSKAVLGVVWGVITYLIRIYINLLVEPQINPVKHFPTVTVAAKMILPKLKVFADAIASPLAFLGTVPANAIAWTTVFFLPGLAGFIVWELKENWRLFEANRPATLRPVMIGHHGETMRRLLLPGFHSGTIPKLFAKLRRASVRAYATGDHRSARRAHEALHHVEEPIRHFVERGPLAYLTGSGRFEEGEILLSDLQLSTNRVGIVLASSADRDRPLRVSFENDAGRLVARLEESGWRDELSDERRHVLDASLAGGFARAGADRLAGTDIHDPDHPEPSHLRLPIPWRAWVAFWDDESNSTGGHPGQGLPATSKQDA